MITNKTITLWVGLTVPIRPARLMAFSDLGRPMALEIGLEATGPGLRPGPGRPIPIPTYHGTPKSQEIFVLPEKLSRKTPSAS